MAKQHEPLKRSDRMNQTLRPRRSGAKSPRQNDLGVDESESRDGQLKVATSIVDGDEDQVAAFSGRLESTPALGFCLDTLRALFAATPTTGKTTIYIEALDAASEDGLDAFVDAVRSRHYDEKGTVELRLGLSPAVEGLLQRLHPPAWHTTLDWDVDDKCLVVTLQKKGVRQRPQ